MTWEDFSEYVTHFTKAVQPNTDYDNQLSILWHQRLESRNPFGIARSTAPIMATQQSVCFSEVPLHCLDRIARRRSRYGIGFTKEFARSQGGGPIWYVERNSNQHEAITQMIARALASSEPSSDPVWMLTPLIDVPGDYPTGSYRFEWEREWRKIGDFVFEPSDVAFLIVPEELHEAARTFFRQARYDNTGPSFECPLIDSSWGVDRITESFATAI